MVRYDPPIPRLRDMTEQERCEALERYMRESARQINLMIDQAEKERRNDVET